MDGDAVAVMNLLERIAQLSRSDEQREGLYPAQWMALRYLARANRYSRTPIALTRYMNATRGTISQTLIALERKGLVERNPSKRDRRSVEVELTAAGRAALASDPALDQSREFARALGPQCAELRDQLERLLLQLIGRTDGPVFGVCAACRHFRKAGVDAKAGLHHCSLLDVALSQDESKQICIEQEAA